MALNQGAWQGGALPADSLNQGAWQGGWGAVPVPPVPPAPAPAKAQARRIVQSRLRMGNAIRILQPVYEY